MRINTLSVSTMVNLDMSIRALSAFQSCWSPKTPMDFPTNELSEDLIEEEEEEDESSGPWFALAV
jgi:hypothetical protein